MAVFFLLFLVVGAALVIRLFAGSMDGDRIDEYIRSRGGRLLTKEWAPFGRGWFGEKDSRLYRITYEDADGAVHRATCKTSLFSGVYFTEDTIVGRSERSPRRDFGREAPRAAEAHSASEASDTDEGSAVAERLRRLDRLRSENLVSPEEHAEQRRRILNRL